MASLLAWIYGRRGLILHLSKGFSRQCGFASRTFPPCVGIGLISQGLLCVMGGPLWIDATTNEWGQMKYASICVRIDLSKPLSGGVSVTSSYFNIFQAVEYEGLASLCSLCGCIGHSEGLSALLFSRGYFSLISLCSGASRGTRSWPADYLPPSG